MRTDPSSQPRDRRSVSDRRCDQTWRTPIRARQRVSRETITARRPHPLFLRKLTFWRTSKRRDASGCLRNGFQILHQGPALFVPQQRANSTIAARTILEGMPAIRVAQKCCIQEERPRCRGGVEAHFDRIEIAAEVKLLRALGGRYQHLIEIGHRSVVQEGRRRPDSITWCCLVDTVRRRRRRQLSIAVYDQ